MKSGNFFSALANEPYYKSLFAEIRASFENSTVAESDYSALIYKWTENLNPDCSYTNDFLSFIVPGLTQDQVINEKIKSITVRSNHMQRELYFAANGLLVTSTTSFLKASDNKSFCVSFKYDKDGQLLEKHMARVAHSRDTLESTILYYDFNQSRLSSIRVRESKSQSIDTLLILEDNPGYVSVQSFASPFLGSMKNKVNRLYFDDIGRRARLLSYTEQDSITLEWIYEDEGRTVRHLVEGYQKTYEKFNESGQLISLERDNYSRQWAYDKSGRLTEGLFQTGASYTSEYRYKYNSRGLLKAKQLKAQEGKFKMVESYEYEYF